MTDEPEALEPDPELRRLVAMMLDGRLDAADRARLEKRLRDDPAAMAFCGKEVRFETMLEEALAPGTLEWEEIRRMIYDPNRADPSWMVQKLQTFRYNFPARMGLREFSRRRVWPYVAGAAIVLGCALGVWVWHERQPSWELRNGDFEAMDLGHSPDAVSTSLLSWQDYFSSSGAQLCEIGRNSGGKIFAKSGRNVARLRNQAYLTQRILDKNGEGLKAAPGLRVIIKGWSYDDGKPPHTLRGSLRFVASGYPTMIQYEAGSATISLKEGGWHPWRIEITLPDELVQPPSDLVGTNDVPPPLDLTGRELTLSLDNRSPNVNLLLDDISIEVVPRGTP